MARRLGATLLLVLFHVLSAAAPASPDAVTAGATAASTKVQEEVALKELLASPEQDVIKGLSYHPVPLRTTRGFSELPQDDWMAEVSKPLWGPRYRGDLRIIRSLGANMVRLHGVSAKNNHMYFLDEAFTVGLHVAAGIAVPRRSDGSSCQEAGFDCYQEAKSFYADVLKSGVKLTDSAEGSYHPALKYLTMFEQPDLRGHILEKESSNDVQDMVRAIISAFDGMLDAEKEAGIENALVNFTVTFSYRECRACGTPDKHSIGQMAVLQSAMLHPTEYGYEPRNDLAEAYSTRWTNSFNAEGNAEEVKDVLAQYEWKFTSTPVYIAEYRKPKHDKMEELDSLLQHASTIELFLGTFYYSYQVPYWKGGSEEEFGLFGLGEHIITTMDYFGKEYNVWCLTAIQDGSANLSRAAALAKAYGGPFLNTTDLCMRSPRNVDLNQNGYETIAQQNSVHRMAEFLERVVHHLGGVVSNEAGLTQFAEDHKDVAVSSFDSVVAALSQHLDWVKLDPSSARCISDRNADASAVVAQMQRICSMGGDDTIWACLHIPESCQHDTFAMADHIFSSYYVEKGKEASPFKDCYFNNVAMYASSAIWWNLYPDCVKDAPAHLPGVLDVYVGQSGMAVSPLHPRTGSDKMRSTSPTTSTASQTSLAGAASSAVTITSTTQSPAAVADSDIVKPSLGAAAAVNQQKGPARVAASTQENLSLVAVSSGEASFAGVPGWAWMLGVAAVLIAATGIIVYKMPKPRLDGQRKQKGRRKAKKPPQSDSSEEEEESSDSHEEAESRLKAARQFPLPQQPVSQVLLPVDRRQRTSAVNAQYRIAQGAAMAMPVQVPTQMQFP